MAGPPSIRARRPNWRRPVPETCWPAWCSASWPRACPPSKRLPRRSGCMPEPRGGAGREATARARAAELGRTYVALNEAGRGRFLRLLASEFDTDHEAVNRCCATLAAAAEPAERIVAERALRAALLPPRVTLLR